MDKEYIRYLVELNNIQALEKLIKFESETNQFNVNATNEQGMSLLHLASMNGREEIVMLLLKVGAKVNALDKEGKSPLCYAVQSGHLSTCKILLAHNADANLGSPLDVAIANKCFDIATALFFSCKPNDSCILYALPYPEWVKLIVKVLPPSVIMMKNAYGQHVGHICALQGHEQSLTSLLEQVSSQITIFVNQQDQFKNTMLHYAVQTRKTNMVQELLALPCIKPTVTNAEGRNALHIAMVNHDLDMVKLLESRIPFTIPTGSQIEYTWKPSEILSKVEKLWNAYKKIAATEVSEEQLLRFCARDDFYRAVDKFSASDLISTSTSVQFYSQKPPSAFAWDASKEILKSRVDAGLALALGISHWELKHENHDYAVYKSQLEPQLIRITGIIKGVMMDQVMHALCEERIKGCTQTILSDTPSTDDAYATQLASEEVSSAFSIGGHLGTLATTMIHKSNAQIFVYKSVDKVRQQYGLFYVQALGDETVRFVVLKNDEYEQPSFVNKLLFKNNYKRVASFYNTVKEIANRATFLRVSSIQSARKRRKTDSAVKLLKCESSPAIAHAQ